MMSVPSLESLISQHKDEPWPMPACKCGEVCPEERQTDDFDAWHAAHVAEVIRQHHAVVALQSGEAVDGGFTFGGGDERGLYAYPEDGLVYDQNDGVTPDKAHEIGVWWLSAARLADGAEDHQ
ncbi:hypothetical protein SEA_LITNINMCQUEEN_89 [Gordonia phage LitninMcQueen]